MTSIRDIEYFALQIRLDSIRATTAAGSGHPTSCMSIADILATLFFNVMKFKKNEPDYPNNDRLILSKGHAVPAIYAVYKELGVISDADMMSLRSINSVFEGHPTRRWAYTDAGTGSLGQGLSVAAGIALDAKLTGLDHKTFVITGDGELAEGSVWESASFASFTKLQNLITIVDCNAMGQNGCTQLRHDTEAIRKRFEAFGWYAVCVNGHDVNELLHVLTCPRPEDKPFAIVAHTTKGQGMKEQDHLGFHGKPVAEKYLADALEFVKQQYAHVNTLQRPEPKERLPSPITSEQEKYLNELKRTPQLDLKKEDFAADFQKGKLLSTRKAAGLGLLAVAKQAPATIVIDGDVANSTFTQFVEKELPKQFVQSFIAEQNMIGVGMGLASRHRVPFASTFGAFFTRAADQLRMAGISPLPVRCIGSHAGVSIGEDGPSQMALEDIALFRCYPGSVVLYPSDAISAFYLVQDMFEYSGGISYMRTTRGDTPIIYSPDDIFHVGGLHVLRQSDKDQACIVAAGITLHESLKAYEELKKVGVNVSVVDLYSVKPLAKEKLLEVTRASSNCILVVEDHYEPGGIFEAVSSAMADEVGICIHSLAVKQIPRSGKPEELLQFAKIDHASITQTLKKFHQQA